MLPKKLIISAFGPYQKQIEIDFTVFKNQGLFLITGPTGSGKTMIFDAIMFALYNQASGNIRDVSELRSRGVSDKTHTEVDLTFVLHNQEYRVVRSPQYFKAGNKNPTAPKATLYLPAAKPITGNRDVNQKIIDLLGVDAAQFQQISMIAQGEFTKLIFASSEEREKVLSKLFNTKYYQRLQDRLKEKKGEYERKLGDYQRDLINKNKNLTFDKEYDSYGDYLKSLTQQIKEIEVKRKEGQKELDTLKEKLTKITTINMSIKSLEENIALKDKLVREADKYQDLAENISMLQKIKEVLPTYQELSRYQEEIAAKKKQIGGQEIELARQEQEFNGVTKDYNNLDNIHSLKEKAVLEINDLQKKQVQVQENNLLLKQQAELATELASKQIILEKANEDILKKERQIKIDQQKIDSQELLKQQLEICEKESKQIADEIAKIHQISDDYNLFHRIQDQASELKDLYTNQYKEYQMKRDIYNAKMDFYLLNQAGILAQNLKEDMPCPVCGSLHHPHLAKITHQEVNSAFLDQMKLELDQLDLNQRTTYQELTRIKESIRLREIDLNKEAKNYHLEEISKRGIVTLLNQREKKAAILREEYIKLNNDINYLTTLNKSLNKAKEKLENLIKSRDELASQVQSIQRQIDVLTGKINRELAKVAEEDISHRIVKLEEEIIDKQQTIDNIEKRYQLLKQKIQVSKDRINNLKTDLKLLTDKLKVKESDYETKLDDSGLTDLDIQKHSHNIDQLFKYQKQLIEYQTALSNVNTSINTLTKLVGDNQYQDVRNLENQVSLKELEVESQREAGKEKTVELQVKTKLWQEVEKITQKIDKITKPYELYLDLYNVCSGIGGARISFERYILAAYFENIIRYANNILNRLSQGRYQLLRKDARKGAGKKGLDLDILDLENGYVRDVKTLSGGESFKAALSLALGLSQMVQDYAGGIELNTLFIDEGFGTLDSQSLDQAINCLIELQGDNKLIGIISHVRELRERIDNQIVLERENKETKITIIS